MVIKVIVQYRLNKTNDIIFLVLTFGALTVEAIVTILKYHGYVEYKSFNVLYGWMLTILVR